jgi:hypothetical protein
MMLRWLMVAVSLLSLAGCAKEADLPNLTVSASSPGEFAEFRTGLGARFTPEQLKDFDTATQELQLDAMNRDIPTAAGRELDMLAVVNGQPVHAVILLGWKARQARFLREIADMQKLLDRDRQQQARTAPTGTPEAVTARIQSELEVLAQLHRNLAETEHRLAEWSQGKP